LEELMANGNFDWNTLGILLGQGAQAMTAGYPEDPTARTIGGFGAMGEGIHKSIKTAQVAEKRKVEQQSRWDAFIKAISGGKGVTPVGQEGVSGMKVSPKGEITLNLTPGRDFWGEIGGNAPAEGLQPEAAAPAQAAPGAVHPLVEALSKEYPQAIW